MRVYVEKENDGKIIIVPHGRIDTETSEEFASAVNQAIETDTGELATNRLVFDLSKCEYISSSGLRVFLAIRKRFTTNDSIVISGMNESIYEVFDMTGFVDMFRVEYEEGDKQDIKVIFFDVDGTLLSHSAGAVSNSTKRAIKKAQENGIKAVVATGRAWAELSELPVMDIDFDGFLTVNGNICLGKGRRMFAGNEIDPGEVEILVSIFKAGRLPFVLIGEKTRYINYVDDVVIKTQMSTHGTIPDIGEYKGEKIYQCLAFVDENTRKKLDNLLDHCTITSWNETGIDIIAKSGGKAAGIQKFLDEEGLLRTQSMAFGDGENDLDMIEYAGIGVAMGNATDALKKAADYVTASVDDEGIEKALIHFGLI